MARWEPNARGRLEQAAMDLFIERGFEQTTVTEIAERAGLTQRTFFRHYTDKREVLFAGSGAFQEMLVESLAAAPEDTVPIDAVTAAIEAAAEFLQPHREFSFRRRAVIAANPELRERELIKFASLAAALADTLRARGVPEPAASLAAQAGIAVFGIAFDRWSDEPGRSDLPRLVKDSLEELRTVAAGK